MSKSQTLYHMQKDYGANQQLTFGYNRTENSSVTVKLNDERSAAAHRFIISLCEEQLREETRLPAHASRALPAPPTPSAPVDADFSEEFPL